MHFDQMLDVQEVQQAIYEMGLVGDEMIVNDDSSASADGRVNAGDGLHVNGAEDMHFGAERKRQPCRH